MSNKKWVLAIIMALFILPVLSAYLLFYYNTPLTQQTTNHGKLITPPIDVHTISGLATLEGWQLAYYAPGVCEQDCFKNVYYIEQIKKALGKKQRYLIPLFMTATPLPAKTQQELKQEYPHVHHLALTTNAHRQWLQALQNETARLYLIDPNHHVMMSYPDNYNPKDVLSDIQRLLRNAP